MTARWRAERVSFALLQQLTASPSGEKTDASGHDPPPLKWSDLRYVFDIQEDCNGKEAIQA
jgi:hypothetical protein